MSRTWITGTGLYTPPQAISNAELVDTFNRFVRRWNDDHRDAIEAGLTAALETSSVEFIERASGIHSRFVVDREGILEPSEMKPRLPGRSNEEPSLLCEMSLAAAEQALETAQIDGTDLDLVIVACSNLERPYPAIAIEVQHHLGARGYAYDMNVACSSATFALQAAHQALYAGTASRVLVLSPEVCTGHLNFKSRDSHFIFGDAATAVVLERADGAPRSGAFEVLGTRLLTSYSNNIRNNFGFLNRCTTDAVDEDDRLFVQEGRKVFKEVVPLVIDLIQSHLDEAGLRADRLRRLWLHQANLSMNQLIARRLLGREPDEDTVPIVLDRYANTSSAGSIIAFHLHREGMNGGDVGLLCSFGAGYSAGSVLVRRC